MEPASFNCVFNWDHYQVAFMNEVAESVWGGYI